MLIENEVSFMFIGAVLWVIACGSIKYRLTLYIALAAAILSFILVVMGISVYVAGVILHLPALNLDVIGGLVIVLSLSAYARIWYSVWLYNMPESKRMASKMFISSSVYFVLAGVSDLVLKLNW